MTIEDEGYLHKTVELLETIGNLEKGRIGVCTADLKSYDRFAVWFENPVSFREDGSPIYWVTFQPWTERTKFKILE